MKLSEAAHNPSKLFEEATRVKLTVSHAARKHYLESARGHYVSALAGRNPEKQGQTNLRGTVGTSSVLANHASSQVAEDEGPAIPIQTSKGFLKGPQKKLQAVKLDSYKTLSSTTSQLGDVVNRLGVIRNELGKMNGPVLEAMTNVSSDSANGKESPLKGMVDRSSLQKKVNSLKAELESLKREHRELKDNDVGKRWPMPFMCKPENEGCLADKANCSLEYEEVAQNKIQIEDIKIKAKGRKRENDSLKTYAEVEKRPRITILNEARECRMNALDLSKSSPEKMYTTCVSTSESSARVMNREDELESSSHQKKSNHLERGNLMAIKGRIEPDIDDHDSEFSIRDYVFSARTKDISTNWPFSEKILQLCLKHGVKNVLPPFQPMYSLRDSPKKRCLTEKILSSEESNIYKKPSVKSKHLLQSSTTDYCKDLGSFPSVGEKYIAFQTASVVCQSEVGSVSTSNLPLSEAISDEQEATASAVNKTKSSVSQIFNKKPKVALKLSVKSRRGALEDITSACTVPSDTMASKICPVCESFSSSSNTTLNAHIDQCLSAQPSPNWIKNSKVMNPRIKPRKIRSMADICATAPRCTLEDLDRRNGSNWATNLDTAYDNTRLHTEGSNHKVSSRITVNNYDDGSVYVDSNGTKIRIISKLNVTAPSSFGKPREDPKVRKQSKYSKTCKLFSASRKRRLMKHLKYLRVARQKKGILSLKVKGRSAKACATEEATYAGHEIHMKHQQPGPIGKVLEHQEQKNHISSETSSGHKSSYVISLAKKNDPEAPTKVCRYDLRVRSDHTGTGRTFFNKHSHLPKKLRSPPPRSKTEGKRKSFLVPLKLRDPKFNGENTKECAWKSLVSQATSTSLTEREIVIQSDATHNASYPLEEIKSCNLEIGMLPPNPSYIVTTHGNKGFDDPVSSTSLTIGQTDIRLNPCLDPALKKVDDTSSLSKIMMCTDKFQRLLPRDESKDNFPQLGVRDEQMGNANISFGQGISSMEIDPILIPGPPGCDLPSFSDMGSEGEDDVGKGDSSDSAFSPTSAILNLGVANDHVYPGWFGVKSPLDTLNMCSQSSSPKTERFASVSNNLKEDRQCCCSSKEGVPWSAAQNFQESQFQGQRSSLVTLPGEQFADSTSAKWPYGQHDTISFSTCRGIDTENISDIRAHRTGDCDSASHAPILRLMGKDLMVVNNEEDDPPLVRATPNVTETSFKHDKIWDLPLSQSPTVIGPLPYEQGPHIFADQHFAVGPSNMIDSFRSLKCTSGDKCVDKHILPDFNALGAPPLHRRGHDVLK